MRLRRLFRLASGLVALPAFLLVAGARASVAQKPVAEVQVAPPSVTLQVGAKQRLSALAYDADGNVIASGVHYVWSSNNVNVARVDSTGVVTAEGPGSAVINAEAVGSGNPPKRGVAAITVRRGPRGR
jgi:uncharacterized protein YjdB